MTEQEKEKLIQAAKIIDQLCELHSEDLSLLDKLLHIKILIRERLGQPKSVIH